MNTWNVMQHSMAAGNSLILNSAYLPTEKHPTYPINPEVRKKAYKCSWKLSTSIKLNGTLYKRSWPHTKSNTNLSII